MNVRSLPGAMYAAIFLTATHPAFAQTEHRPLQHPFRISLGTFFFGGASTPGTLLPISLLPITAEVGYDFSRLGKQDPVVFQVYADYFGGDSGIRRGGFARLTFQGAFGIGISLRTDTFPAAASIAPYIGLGVGYYSMKASAANIPGTFGGVRGGTRRKGGVYPKILVGVQTNKRLFAEAEYQFMPDFSDIGFEKNIRGVNLRVGHRF